MTPTIELALTVAELGLATLRLQHKAPPLADPDPGEPRREEPAPGAPPLPTGRPIAERLREFFAQQEKAVLAEISPVTTAAIPDDLSVTDWTDPMTAAMTPIIQPYWEESGQRTMAGLGLDPSVWEVVNPKIREKIREQSFHFCSATNETTSLKLDAAHAELRRQLEEGIVDRGETLVQLRKRVQSIFTEATESRAYRIANTEASRSVHLSGIEAAKQSGVARSKTLIVSSDACPLCKRIKASEPEGGWPLDDDMATVGDHPYYSHIPCPPLHPGCACSQGFEIDEAALAAGPELPDGVTPEDVLGAGRETAPAESAAPAEPAEPEHVAARRARVAARLAEVGPEIAAAGAEADRLKAEYDRIKDSGGSAEARLDARQAWFDAKDRRINLAAEHGRLAKWSEAVKDIPSLIPPGPIAARIADYREGDAKVRRVLDELTPIRDRAQAARAEYERASLDWDRADREKQTLLDELYMQAAKGKKLSKAKQKRLDELTPLVKELADRRQSLLWAKGTKAAAEIRERLADILAVDKPVGVRWEHGGFLNDSGDAMAPLDGATRRNADEATAWVRRITRDGDGPGIARKIGQRDGQRAYHAGNGTHIAVKPGESVGVIVHELGHAIDESVTLGGDNAVRRSKEFLDHRVAGEKPVKIKDLAGPGSEYRDDEIGREDEFGRVFDRLRAHYVGKDYGGRATEIVSMGLEQLYNDPIAFAEKDPEFARYLFGILDGSLR